MKRIEIDGVAFIPLSYAERMVTDEKNRWLNCIDDIKTEILKKSNMGGLSIAEQGRNKGLEEAFKVVEEVVKEIEHE